MARTKPSTNLKRVNINLPINVIEQVKEYADELGVNTTSAYILLLNQALEYRGIIKQMPTLITLYGDMKNAVNVDDNVKLS